MISSRNKEFVVILAIAVSCMAKGSSAADAEGAKLSSQALLLWDTSAHLGEKLEANSRSNWNAVPNDLLLLEKDPPKASSDPGYYGREYSFQGDAVVEMPKVAAVFSSARGCLSLYSKPDSSTKDQHSDSADWRKIVDVCPNMPGTGPATISNVEVLRNADDELVLQVAFARQGSKQVAGVFSFDKSGVIEVTPGEDMKRMRLSSSIQYGVVPGFVGDDLIFGGPDRPTNNTVAVPCENMFLGLLEGEGSELVMTWPKGKQRMSLHFGEENPFIKSVDFENGAQSFYLGVLSARGIWHKETLRPEYLEKDIRVEWRRPFPARWKTQLFEEELKTTFTFRQSKGHIWRGVAGSYEYPVWFSGEDTFYHLSKKVQPRGESVIYCLEGQDTPLTVLTPADILKQSLGRQAAAGILDLPGRKLRTHHRRGATGVRRACTCGCTEAIQAVFEAGEEVGQKDYIQGALDDMLYFVRSHVERINEYQRFADNLLKQLQEKQRSSPQLKPFLGCIEEIVRQIPQECDVQKENMKNLAYADELSKKTIMLASRKEPNNVKAYMDLLKAWRDMGGAQDYVVAKCHVVTRNLCQTAGYACASLPDAVPLAEEIRAECRRTLRNPDGYEIWADY